MSQLLKLKPAPFTSQPQYPVEVVNDADMVVAISPIGGGNGFRRIKGNALTVTGTLAQEASAIGLGKRGGSGKYLSAVPYTSSLTTISLIIVLVPKNTGVRSGIFSIANGAVSGTPRFLIQQENGNIKFYWGGSYKVTANAVVVVNKPMVLGFTHDGTTGSCYINGVFVGSSAAALAGDSGTAWYLGSGYEFQYDAIYLEHFQWNKALLNSEMVRNTLNPWQIFQPQTRNIWVPSAGGGTQYNQGAGGTISFVGAYAKVASKMATGVLAFASGAVTTLIGKVVSGAISFSGGTIKRAARGIGGMLTTSGITIKATAVTLLGAISFGGGLSATRVLLRAVGGALTFASGEVQRHCLKVAQGSITMGAGLARSASVHLAGALAFVGGALGVILGFLIPSVLRKYLLGVESRAYSVAIENRAYVVSAENRVVAVAIENRIYTI